MIRSSQITTKDWYMHVPNFLQTFNDNGDVLIRVKDSRRGRSDQWINQHNIDSCAHPAKSWVKNFVAFCKQVNLNDGSPSQRSKCEVVRCASDLLKGHAVWASGVSSYLFLCWDSIPWTKLARSLPPRKTACATNWKYKRKQLN